MKVLKVFPGIILSVGVALLACRLESLLPIHLIGSAIAAIAPTIDADDNDVAYAMSATFLFDMAMIVLFPIMGQAMGMTDQAFGIWAGTAVNDTSSVVATGYAFSEGAGDFDVLGELENID